MTKRTEPKEKTDPVDIFVPKRVKISIGVEAAKHEITPSELVRAPPSRGRSSHECAHASGGIPKRK
mgnify:CR=1 FL=1